MNKILSLIEKSIYGEEYYIRLYRKLGAKIGDNCKFYNVNLDYGHAYLISIGDGTILTNCTILSHDASMHNYVKKTKVGHVNIGKNCFIGYGSIIMPNITIGDNCIIGAGSIVTKNVEQGKVVAGNPARVICNTEEFISKHKQNMNKVPVFNKYWKYKSKKEKEEESNMLTNTFGYDE